MCRILLSTILSMLVASAAGAQQSVTWTAFTNASVSGTTLTKAGGCDGCADAGAKSQQQLTSGDGYVQFTVTETSKLRYLALSSSATDLNTIDFAWRVEAGWGEVRENGVYKADVAVVATDVLKIAIEGSIVKYYQNGLLVYPSTAPVPRPLYVGALLLAANSTINNAIVQGSTGSAPQTYDLRTDTAVIGTGPATAPTIGPAGDFVIDNEFGTRISRVTDAANYPDGRSWGTPSGPNMNAISSDDRKFYAISDDGSTALIYDFDPATGGFLLNHEASFNNEPTFSRKIEKPNILYSAYYGYTVVSYNADTRTQSAPLITLTDEVGPMSQNPSPEWPNGQYMSVVYSSQGTVERIAVSYGGVQDTHPYMTVFDVDNPANRITINTRTSQVRVNGGSWQPLLTPSGALASINFGLHSISIDRSGKWVKLDISGNEGGAAHTAFFNVETQGLHEWTSNAWLGHYALGWEAHVSCIADPNGGGTYQWLFTDLRQPGLPPPWRPLITPPPPANNQVTTDHTSWNNARADALVPVISGTQRGLGSAQWDRWFDEIVAVATDPNAPAQVYRAGRHYMASYDANGNLVYTFRDTPRPQVTHNGMWTFFTSNWGLTLGTYGSGASNQRRDLFVVRMARE